MQHLETLLAHYGWEGTTLVALLLAMWFVQLRYYLFVYGPVASYRNNRRPTVREAEPPVSVVVLFVVPAFLWVAGNFLVSAINEGEGSLANVYMATAYSLTPYIVIGPLVIVSTYVLTLNEAVIVHYLWAIALLWSAGLLCMSVREIHGYTVKETVKSSR